MWSSIASLSARRYIVRVQDDPTPVVVDVAATVFTGGAPRQRELTAADFAPLTV